MRKFGLAVLLSFLCLSSANGLAPVESSWACAVCFRVNGDDKQQCEYCGGSR